MTIRNIAIAAIALLLLSPLAFNLPNVQAESDEEKTELHKKMEVIGETMGALRKQLKDPAKNEDTLAKIVAIQKLTLECKDLKPAMLAQVADGEKATFLLNYRKEMVRMMTELMKLELMIAEGNNEDAAKQFRALIKVKYSGHEKFQPEE